MYSIKKRISYSDVSVDRRVTIAQLTKYMQDCTTFQSEEIGYGLEYVLLSRKAWLLAAWQVEVKRYPKMPEEIKVTTWHESHKGLLANRNFIIEDSEGNCVARANSVWFLNDIDTGALQRISEADVKAYGTHEKIDMEYKSRKIKVPATEGKTGQTFRVRKADLDTNGHVNNTNYIAMALDFVDDASKIKAMRVDYKKPALLGDMICPVIYEEGQLMVIELRSQENETFVIVEFELDGE